MQLDAQVLDRIARDVIAVFPVTARHRNRTMQVRLNAAEDITQLMDSGLRDNVMIQIIGVKSDFGNMPPKSMDDFDVLVNDEWKRFQVRNVPDFYDPLSPTFWINLQSVNKGIE